MVGNGSGCKWYLKLRLSESTAYFFFAGSMRGGCLEHKGSQWKPHLGQTKDTLLFELHLWGTQGDLGFPAPPGGVQIRFWTSRGGGSAPWLRVGLDEAELRAAEEPERGNLVPSGPASARARRRETGAAVPSRSAC